MTSPLDYLERLKYDTPERRHLFVIIGAVVTLVVILNLLPDGDGVANPRVETSASAATTPDSSAFMGDASVEPEMRAEALAEQERMESYRRFAKASAAGGSSADLILSYEGTKSHLEDCLRREPKRAGCRYLLVKYLVQGSYTGNGQFASDPILRASQELRMALEASDSIERRSWCLRLFTELQGFLVQVDTPASKELLDLLDKNSD